MSGFLAIHDAAHGQERPQSRSLDYRNSRRRMGTSGRPSMASLLRRMARGGIDTGQTGIVRPSSDPRGHTVDLHQWLAFPDVYFAEMSFADNKRAAVESRLEE